MKLDLYTEQEKTFITSALELLEIKYTVSTSPEVFTHDVVTFEADREQQKVLAVLMKYNFERTFK